MPEIAEPLRPVRVVAKPKKFPPLRSFCSGRKGNRWEKLVNEWARSVYLGQQAETQTVLVLEDAHRKLIGVAGFKPKPLPGSEVIANRLGKLVVSAQYIQMFGIDRLYHGRRLEDGSRLGDVLLCGMLEQIERACGDRMPHVWAHVTPENARARALFARHGFEELPYSGEGEIAYARSPHRGASFGTAGVRVAHLIARMRGTSKPSPALPQRSG